MKDYRINPAATLRYEGNLFIAEGRKSFNVVKITEAQALTLKHSSEQNGTLRLQRRWTETTLPMPNPWRKESSTTVMLPFGKEAGYRPAGSSVRCRLQVIPETGYGLIRGCVNCCPKESFWNRTQHGEKAKSYAAALLKKFRPSADIGDILIFRSEKSAAA